MESQALTSKKAIRSDLFAREYVIDLNGERAALAAGYSAKTARAQASHLLTKNNVRAKIDALLSKRASKLEITGEKVLEELARLGFSNMMDYIRVQDGDAYVDLSLLTRDQAAAIQEITVEEYTEGRGEEKRDIKRTKLKLADKAKALEMLGRYRKLFTEQVEHHHVHEVTHSEQAKASRSLEKIAALASASESPIEAELLEE